MRAAATASSERRSGLLLALALAAHATVAVWLAFNGQINLDEGFYGLAAREVWHGLIPYRDFGYTQAPLFPYINGALMKLTGFGFLQQRLVNAFWGLAAVAAGLWFLRRRRGLPTALAFAACLTTSFVWVYYTGLGKTYAFTGFVMLVVTLRLLGGGSAKGHAIVLGLGSALVIGCRLPLAPFFVLTWAGLVWSERSWRFAGWALLWALLPAAAVFLPFWWASPDNFVFWCVQTHRAALFRRQWHPPVRNIFAVSPAMWLALAALAAGLCRRGRASSPVFIGLLAGIIATLASNLLPQGVYQEYMVPLVPTVLLLALWFLGARPAHPRWLAGGAVALAGIDLCFFPPCDPHIYANVRCTARLVAKHSQESSFFVGSMPVIALENGMPVPRDLMMGSFSLSAHLPPALARRRHLLTPRGFDDYLDAPSTRTVVLSRITKANFAWSIPDYYFTPRAVVAGWARRLEHAYFLAYTDEDFVVYLRKPAGTGSAPSRLSSAP